MPSARPMPQPPRGSAGSDPEPGSLNSRRTEHAIQSGDAKSRQCSRAGGFGGEPARQPQPRPDARQNESSRISQNSCKTSEYLGASLRQQKVRAGKSGPDNSTLMRT